ncbi:ubiquinol oxidase subunit II, cyanide insensitive [Acinetobacter gyllenbergii]|jgi:cytochrome bd ubiquinol oxidase subunit II|uniref:Cytochrome d ubiquinol oxidase, subunit II n=1 Tax=Acinetobacter gyllenbergii CIP 110306 = MTCC 11365 TaxID=1217657 RepID=A0A829HKZ5_9GAMM|nr:MULTISPECIES: cytochrome d ubiquinol oxidase subunit II [Acinetobacter]EPF90598.1 cytochrome d ubiquinol oxidase, subunit II [Acinetobacter gyllenbergii CIP 110306 = MTCC 11365]EPH33908.1 putative Cytochrome bd2, subunit II [Acinetobacter gyllenbergii CIP 110306 = MTCC 11365]MCU4377171.1 cytochrome d ubiquinol oxidase subunit II [Acinetobacter haemolyticus]MEB3792756.1 cytochrome d ubiquinol oxidase subunit II [Acinetobacter sp. IK40]NNP69015.1 cytochrome d ubiquinol oxidase subunit II [Aci
MIDLSLIWIVIIAIGVFIYIVLDGFDLGIGILFPFIKDQQERDVMMNTVAPVWDGNETWMVLGGAGLFAAFPMVYAAVLSAFYMPIILMVIALIFRGVAFEFRFKANRTKHLWDAAFIGGSVLSSFLQGVILGAYIQGIHIVDGRYAGGGLDWLTPFSLFTGVGVVVVYAALGCGWLIMKTDDRLQISMYNLMPKLIIGLLLIFASVSIYTPLAHPMIAERWFTQPQILYFSPVPILVLVFTYLTIKACQKRQESMPFLYTLALVFLAYTGFLISIFPYIIPPSVTIWDAAAPANSQLFALIGALILIPIIIIYTIMAYWVFRDKVRIGDEGYH